MNKTFAVIRREFVARVHTRSFVISTLLVPVFFVAIMVIPAMMMTGTSRSMRVAIVDGTTSDVGARIESHMAMERLGDDSSATPRYTVNRIAAPDRVDAVRDSLVALTGLGKKSETPSFDGVLVIRDDALTTGELEYYGTNVGSPEAMGRLEGALRQVVTGTRFEQSGIEPAVVARAMERVNVSTHKVTDGKATGESGGASFIIAYAMGFILYFGVFMYGQQTMTSVVEEKTSRIMEVLASSLTPFQMLLGKVLGVGITGLLQMGIWGTTIFLVTSQRGRLASLAGVSPDAMQQMPIPTMPVDLLVVFLIYFALGFLLYGALFAAIGSMCNSVKETQQYASGVMMLIVFGFFGVFAMINDPTGGIGMVMSYVPFFSPFVMPVRWSLASVPLHELALSIGAMIAALVAVSWLAGRIYRTGILMYGKKPSLGELFRWVRAG